MTKKPSTSKGSSPLGHVLNPKLTPREMRVLAAVGQDKKKDQTPPKTYGAAGSGKRGSA